VWDKLIDHPAFIERVKYSQLGAMTTDLLARLIGVDRVVVGMAGKNTATEGQTDSMSYIWGKKALLAYIAPTLRPKMLTTAFTYKFLGDDATGMRVERLRGSTEEDRKGTYVRAGGWYYTQKVVSASCAYLIDTAIA
jgi:hypothetical protein